MKAQTLLTALFVTAFLAAPSVAHHSISAEFDTASKPVTLNGTVTNVDWMNPHTYVFVDVKDPALGKTRTWACELASPNELARRGFTRESLKIGMIVRVSGTRAKDGSLRVHTETLTANNGVVLGVGGVGSGK